MSEEISVLEQVLATVTATLEERRTSGWSGGSAAAVYPHSVLQVDLDLDSVAMLDIVSSLERVFEIRIIDNLRDPNALRTPAAIAQLVSDLRGRTSEEPGGSFS